MNLHIAQLVALACHFNGRARKLADVGIGAEHPTCRACESIKFLSSRPAWLGLSTRWEPMADEPNEFIMAESSPELSAYLVREPLSDSYSERLSLGPVSGGGRWWLVIASVNAMDRWGADWKKAGRDAPADRPWRVRYYRVEESVRTHIPKSPPINDLVAGLRRVLMDLYYFAQQQDLAEHAERFSGAEKCLSADDPLMLVKRRDLAPAGVLYRPAERLLACAQTAWVFGGKESWSNLVFSGAAQDKHQEWTNQLYDLLNQAICAATNSAAGGVV